MAILIYESGWNLFADLDGQGVCVRRAVVAHKIVMP